MRRYELTVSIPVPGLSDAGTLAKGAGRLLLYGAVAYFALAGAAERGWVPPPIARLLRLDGTPSDPATPRPPPPSSDEVSAAGAAYARALIEAVVAGDEAALASFASTDALADGLRKEFHDRTRSAWAPAAAALEREFGATSPAPLDAAKAERIRSWFRRLHAGMKGGLR